MIRRTRALRTLAVAAATMSQLGLPSHAQDFGERSMKSSFPVENRPKVDEKAYKAALIASGRCRKAKQEIELGHKRQAS